MRWKEILAGGTGESVPKLLEREMRASNGEHLTLLQLRGLVAGAGSGSVQRTRQFLRPICPTPTSQIDKY